MATSQARASFKRFTWPLVVFVLASALYVAVRAKRDTLVDFEVYRTAAARAVVAAPLYRPEDGHYQFKYLPVFALLAAPLAWVPRVVATPAWFGLSVVLLYVFMRQSARALPDRRRRLVVLVWLVAICTGKFWVKELAFGQTNLLLGVLLLAALASAERGRWWAAGALVGVGTFVKPYAILFFPWLAIAGGLVPTLAAAGVLALGLLAPAAVYGWHGNVTLLAGWYRTVSSTTAPNLFNAENISFATMWAKWLGAGAVASMLALASSVAAVGLVGLMLLVRRRVARPAYLEFGALLLFVPLLSPQGWDYVLLIAAPAFFVLFDRWSDVSPAWRIATAVAIAVVSFTIFDVVGRSLYVHAMRLSVVTVGAMAIAVSLAHLRWKSLA